MINLDIDAVTHSQQRKVGHSKGFRDQIDRETGAFNINIKDESRKWDGHKDAVLSVAVSAATRQAASGAYDGEVVLWNIDEGKIIRRFHSTPGGVAGKENPPLPRQGEGRGEG